MKKNLKDILLLGCYLFVGIIIFTLGGAIRSVRHAPHTPRFVSQPKESTYSVKKSILRVEDLPSRNQKNTPPVSHKDPALSIVLWGIGGTLAFLVIVVFLLNCKSIVSSLKHKISIVKNRTRSQAKKHLFKERINIQDALSILNESSNLETNAISTKEVEEEICSAFPSLRGYLSSLFTWLSKEVSQNAETIFSAARQKNVPVKAVLCALLFFQVSEQMKYPESVADVADVEKLHQYLLDKLSAYKYFGDDPSDKEK